jgi:hypothetical protein
LRAPPRRILLAAQVVAAALLFFFIGREIVRQWTTFRSQPLEADPRWWDLVASGALVLLAHALLVQTWRLLMGAGGVGAALPFWTAARIWSVASLAKYVPGKIWQITTMGTMAHQAGVSPVVSTGSALLSTIINIASGIALVLGLGWGWLDVVRGDARYAAIALLVLAVLGLLALPWVIPRLGAITAKLTGRPSDLAAPPPRIILAAIVGNVLAWVLYGIAFLWVVRGVLGTAPGALWLYVAVYTASYVVGYLFFLVPGGIGPREAVMYELLTALHLATPKQALLVAAASRIWLTILEIAPGLIFMARGGRPPSPPTIKPPDARTT